MAPEGEGTTSTKPIQLTGKKDAANTELQKKHNNNGIAQQKKSKQDQIIQKQPELPPYKAISQDDNLGDGETILNVQELKEFQFMSAGQEINKMIYLNQQMIGGIGGSKFMVFDVSSQDSEKPQRIHTIQIDAEYTDLAYLELDDQNGQLYLATKKGNIYTYIKEGTKNITFRQSSSQIHILDKPGVLYIQVSVADRLLYSVGEEKIVKVWSLKTMRELKRLEVQDLPTAFHLDQKTAFIGGSNFIQIWEQSTGTISTMKGLESKVTKILTNQSKMFVSMLEKIKVYKKIGMGEYLLNHELHLRQIITMQVLRTWPMLVISYIDDKSIGRVSLYNYVDLQPPEMLMDKYAQSCAVREYNKINYLAFGLQTGVCLIYKMEQRFQQSQ